MTFGIRVLPGICLTLGLLACRPVAESVEPIEWQVSWTPATAHEDQTPIEGTPAYELEMTVDEAGQGPWKVVWSGSATNARFKAPPGRRCFRAVTLEDGARSQPSQVHCATKSAG